MQENLIVQDTAILQQNLGEFPEPVIKPPFIVVSGLPGTGKSYFCRHLREKLPSLIIESDAMRKALFPKPVYSLEESIRLFSALHVLIEDLLHKGIPVIFDATNLAEHHREKLYHIADKISSKLILVRVEAPSNIVFDRLQKRQKGERNHGDISDADWIIYQNMKNSMGKIKRNHFMVDTSIDIKPAITKIIRSTKN